MDSISEEYGVDQAATGSAPSQPVVGVRGLVKRYGSHEAVAASISKGSVPGRDRLSREPDPAPLPRR
jgi:hypothetical protein